MRLLKAVLAVNTAKYPTVLTEAQWNIISRLLPKRAKTGRRPIDRRLILNAILYITKTGAQWRMLPNDFPNFKTVFHVFRDWNRIGLLEKINKSLREQLRVKCGKNANPSAAILDSQSVKSDCHGGQSGYDAGKKIKGRKRHLLVDTLGLLLGIHVTEADFPEREGGYWLIERLRTGLANLRKIWADNGYSGTDFSNRIREVLSPVDVETVIRGNGVKGFKLLPHRWIVERTFAWLMRSRRLCRDYETTTLSAEAFVLLSMIHLQLRRLTK